jgi:hypothetical protein
MRKRNKWLVVGGVLLVMTLCLLVAAWAMRPIKRGTAEEFWQTALAHGFSGTYPPRDGWFIYYHQGFHGQFLFKVRDSDAASYFPRALQRLESPLELEKTPTDVQAGYKAWLVKDPTRSDAILFLALARESNLSRFQRESAKIYKHAVAADEEFDVRWRRINRYWLTVLFEFLYFGGLIVFAFWPWLRSPGRWRWALHLGLLPVLLFLPYFMGYATMTFTSAGPSGGALYPWIIIWFGGLNHSWTSLDEPVLKHMPTLLAPIAQSSGPWLSLSGGGPGPVAIAIMGLIAAALVFVTGTVIAMKSMCGRFFLASAAVAAVLAGYGLHSHRQEVRSLRASANDWYRSSSEYWTLRSALIGHGWPSVRNVISALEVDATPENYRVMLHLLEPASAEKMKAMSAEADDIGRLYIWPSYDGDMPAAFYYTYLTDVHPFRRAFAVLRLRTMRVSSRDTFERLEQMASDPNQIVREEVLQASRSFGDEVPAAEALSLARRFLSDKETSTHYGEPRTIADVAQEIVEEITQRMEAEARNP